MTEQEYDDYRAHAVPMYADDLVRARGMSPEVALPESERRVDVGDARRVAATQVGDGPRDAVDADRAATTELAIEHRPFEASRTGIRERPLAGKHRARHVGVQPPFPPGVPRELTLPGSGHAIAHLLRGLGWLTRQRPHEACREQNASFSVAPRSWLYGQRATRGQAGAMPAACASVQR